MRRRHRQVQHWCAKHPEFMQHVEQPMSHPVKDELNVTEADVRAVLDHSPDAALELVMQPKVV